MELITSNLLTPMVLCYVLGLIAGRLGSDLRIPNQLYESITIYLLLAIGFKGGVEIAQTGLASLLLPGLFSVTLGIMIPLYVYPLLRRLGRLSRADSASIAAHYGSVSAVTFAAALTMLETLHIPYNGFMNALLALMESPAIIVGVILAGRAQTLENKSETAAIDWRFLLREALLSKSVLLLLGGLAIGVLSGENGMKATQAFFVAPFKGVLSLFLLELGISTAERLNDLRRAGVFLTAFGIILPIFNGALGVGTGWLAGLNLGGATLLGVLAASASYIAAPAAMRVAVPSANPSLSLTAVLGVTFPFNITLGLPLYLGMARWLYGV
ncbi:MAG: sodium-dependent bicarbonate transport family permease [Anaerolineales bacterium]|nr:sodium-dependent bicarbonate transport family permease [Anaerolineales bacterium]